MAAKHSICTFQSRKLRTLPAGVGATLMQFIEKNNAYHIAIHQCLDRPNPRMKLDFSRTVSLQKRPHADELQLPGKRRNKLNLAGILRTIDLATAFLPGAQELPSAD